MIVTDHRKKFLQTRVGFGVAPFVLGSAGGSGGFVDAGFSSSAIADNTREPRLLEESLYLLNVLYWNDEKIKSFKDYIKYNGIATRKGLHILDRAELQTLLSREASGDNDYLVQTLLESVPPSFRKLVEAGLESGEPLVTLHKRTISATKRKAKYKAAAKRFPLGSHLNPDNLAEIAPMMARYTSHVDSASGYFLSTLLHVGEDAGRTGSIAVGLATHETHEPADRPWGQIIHAFGPPDADLVRVALVANALTQTVRGRWRKIARDIGVSQVLVEDFFFALRQSTTKVYSPRDSKDVPASLPTFIKSVQYGCSFSSLPFYY